jgi:glucokinase
MKIFDSLQPDKRLTHTVLTGDIGGTNTTVACIGVSPDSYSLITKKRYKTAEITAFYEPVRELLEMVKTSIDPSLDPSLYPAHCCLSAAGPVENNRCRMSNVETIIDGDRISKKTGLKTVIINDFLALSYSLPLLDYKDTAVITEIPHPDGSLPSPSGSARTVIGAGTGLGVGYQVNYGGKVFAFPSEGGHFDFPAFDEETEELKRYVTRVRGEYPGTELFVSGRGIVNIYHFFKERRGLPDDSDLHRIDKAPDSEKPSLIAGNSRENQFCRDIMLLFVKIYGKFAGNIAITFLPGAGLFLAGGIVTKNEDLFLHNNVFMHYFESSYKANIRDILKKTPVYIIKDYGVSLFGAAHAFDNLSA